MANYAVKVAAPQKEGESAEYRNYQAKKAPWHAPSSMEDVTTLHELVNIGCKRFAEKPFAGQRKFIKIHTETREITKKIDGEDRKVKKDWNYFEMGPYNWQSFKDFNDFRHKLGAGLVHYGVTPGEKRFHLYAKSCREWMQTAIACTSQNITIVTAYDTLGIEGLQSSINQTGTYGILLDKDNIESLGKALEDAPSIKLVVYRDSEGELTKEEKEAISKFEKYNGGITVIPFTKLLEAGETHPVEAHPPKADDLCCIMYTSGSTGPPKGVVLKHGTVVAGVAGVSGNVSPSIVGPGDYFLSILPLAHIFEFTAELAAFFWGAALGYGNPKTISDASMRNCKGDMRELRPTIMIAVPAVFEAVKKGIVGKVNKMPYVTQKVFWGAYKLKSTMKSLHLPVPLVDSLIFKNIKDATGGRLRYVMNGGAPLSDDTRLFVNTLIAPLIMGYGLTETNAMCAISNPERVDLTSTGELVTSVTVKLVDVPDAGYFSKNNQGEIWIKGPAVSPGYYKNDQETKDAYTEDGWFKTGDIGELTSNGTIRIVDRKKNLIKTLNGEYVALERLESLYRSNGYVANICVFADSDHAKPVAVVVPVEAAIKDLAAKLNMQYTESIVHDKKITNSVLKDLQDTAKNAGLRPVEWLAGITLSDEEWTPQNGFVTSAQKLQRKKIGKEYAAGIKEAFKNA